MTDIERMQMKRVLKTSAPQSAHDRRLYAEAARRGATIRRRGHAFVVMGPGIYVMAAGLHLLRTEDLEPVREERGLFANG